jgi:hypothetical protein
MEQRFMAKADVLESDAWAGNMLTLSAVGSQHPNRPRITSKRATIRFRASERPDKQQDPSVMLYLKEMERSQLLKDADTQRHEAFRDKQSSISSKQDDRTRAGG